MSTQNSHWFRVHQPLSKKRRLFLTVLSFLIPILIWCIVSYTPFIWHPDIKLDVSANRNDVTTVYTAGDRLSKDYFPTFVEAVRKSNHETEQGINPNSSERATKRSNQKDLRQISSIAVKNGWIDSEQTEDDAAIYHIWRDLATGAKTSTSPQLSDENLTIIKKNWAQLSAVTPDYKSSLLPTSPILKLIPQGSPSNPVYLPAPHEVITTGWRDFHASVDEGEITMSGRFLQSIKIVFGGFLLSCLIGIPLGVLCGTFDFFSKLFEPFIDFFRYLPAPTFSTLLVAIFAVHDAPKIALVFVGTFFQMVLIISKTTRLLDHSLLEAAQTLGARPAQLLKNVVIPGILPSLYDDLRILLGWSWTWLVIAELIGVKSGLTEFIETQGRYRNFDRVFPIIFMIGFVGFFTDQLLALSKNIFFPWTRTGNTWFERLSRFFKKSFSQKQPS
ncbi:MAG: ABC transporter permease [Akkermansiaceae bacterium]